jgi:mitochondrial chaperone BCS1
MVTIKHQCVEDLEYLLKHSIKYYHKYCCNSEDTDETYVIYSNDENYWDRIGSRNKRDLKYIYLPKKQKKDIVADFNNFLKPETKERYLKAGILYKRIYLFEGIPGGGKTSLITALASKYEYNVALLSLDPKTTDLKLSKAIQNLPEKCVLVVEDIDGLFVERRDGDNSKNCVTMSGLLNVFDGIATPEGLIVFITTNFKSNLDAALIRPGRVDYVLKFDYIKTAQIKEMYRVFMENKFDDAEMNHFVDEFKTLNVHISASLLQQYLFKYFDNPKEALENINDIKTIKEACKTRTNANEEGDLYM